MTTAAARRAAFGVEKVRKEFPALDQRVDGKRLVYLDSACTALKPRVVAERLRDFYLHWGGCGGKRSTHLASQKVEEWTRRARGEVAAFVGAETPNEIVFTSGTTESANLVARALPREERREVVLSDLEHNAVFLPFFEAARRGEVVLKFARQRDGAVPAEELERLVGEKTALVCLTRASNVYGGAQPVAEACRIAHRRGALVFSDYAQFYSSHRESLAEANVDFAAFSGHKLGGPFGVGVLYGKENLLNRLGHYKVGGGTVKSVAWTAGAMPEVDYLDAPMRLEAGVQNFGGILGLAEALGFLGGLPAQALREHVGGLARRLARGLARFSQLRVLGGEEFLARGSLVSFVPERPEFSTADFNLFLNHELPGRCVAVRVGEHCAHLLHQSLGAPATVRASLFAYSTAEEVDLFLDAVGCYLREACP